MTNCIPVVDLPEPERLAYSPDRLAYALDVGRSFVFEQMSAGKLQAVKAGRRTLISRESAIAWLRNLPKHEAQARAAGLIMTTLTMPPVTLPNALLSAWDAASDGERQHFIREREFELASARHKLDREQLASDIIRFGHE